MKKIGCLALAAVLGLMVVGCASTNSKENKPIELKNKDINFNSEKGSLFVSNNTAEDVVVFVGKVEKGNLIGGIHANTSRSFDISKIPGIPSSGSLLVRVATANLYKEKARITEEDVIYTGLVVYDLNDSGDKISLSIYRGVDASQKECIYVSNESENFVLELRLGNPSQGEVIATLAPLTTNKRIYLSARDDSLSYDFYPTFIYVNPKTNEKTSMNNPGKADRKRAYPEPIGGDITPIRFEGPSASNVGYDVAFVSVQNDTNSGIEFRNAGTPLKNQKGRRFTASGRTDVYEISSQNGEAGKLYTSLTFEFDNFTKKKISPFTFLPGYKYDVIVTELDGNYQYDIREVGKKSLVEDARIQLFME